MSYIPCTVKLKLTKIYAPCEQISDTIIVPKSPRIRPLPLKATGIDNIPDPNEPLIKCVTVPQSL